MQSDPDHGSPFSSDISPEERISNRKLRPAPRKYTRVNTACDACRLSKTRCDSARPVCAKCVKRGVSCVYPDHDPFSILDSWGSRILDAVERQERTLSENYLVSKNYLEQHHQPSTALPSVAEVDLESASRNDALSTPITGSDTIINWPIFPKDKPVTTYPESAYSEKPDRFPPAIPSTEPKRMLELREIFMTKIQIKNPIIDPEQLDTYIAAVLENGIDWSASSCLILLVFAMAAIWGNYPENDTRILPCTEPPFSPQRTYISLSVPEHRMKESLSYFSMARKRMSAAFLDDSLLGVQCYCLFGIWYQYNIEPIQGWKVFRTASILWQAYNLKHREGKTRRSEQEESLEQRLYWTCLKTECEIRYELTDLPSCTLSLSDFPFSFPTFTLRKSYTYPEEVERTSSDMEAASSYYYLAEISLRRLLNRVRNAVKIISPAIDAPATKRLSDTLSRLQDQLQEWMECLPQTMRFNVPLESQPRPDEHELVKLLRERYVEVRELICRSYLYLCIHAQLDPEQAEFYGRKASEALLLAVYRIQTENPFFRHPGSWGACRVRFNHALCLIAAFRAKSMGVPSADYINLPQNWADCVQVVTQRLKIWSEEGAGIKELSILLEWLMHE